MPASLLQRRLLLFPLATAVETHQGVSCLTIAGLDLQELAERYGTPLYLYDRQTLDEGLRQYQSALQHFYPASWRLAYAGKAFLCLAMAQWVAAQQVDLDCSSAGEVAIARRAGLEREHILLHGVNKSQLGLQTALPHVGALVVDHLDELDALLSIYLSRPPAFPELWLRLRPGIAADTHLYIRTGQTESKFGMSPSEVLQGIKRCLDAGLTPGGLHFHLGSQFRDVTPYITALETALDLALQARAQTGWELPALSLGGGWGVAYHEDDLPHPEIETFIQAIASVVLDGCRKRSLPIPRLHLEPGRSLIARAGVCLYRVGAVKHTGSRRWLLVDGGLGDNPRPALYGARYSCLPVINPDRTPVAPAWLGGPFCESGDTWVDAVLLPDVRAGELLAVPVCGAYQLSMASNYNGACRPAVLWLENGQAHLIRERELMEDLYRRDRLLSHLPSPGFVP